MINKFKEKQFLIINLYLIFILLAFLSNNASAQSIAFVNQQKLLEKAPQAESARNKLQKEFAPRDKTLVGLQKEIQDLTIKLQKDAAVMSASAVNKLKRKISSLRRDLERDKEAFREDLTLRQNEELVKLQQVVSQAIAKVAEEKKYDLIVSDGVIYASKRIDITEIILDALKLKFNEKQ
ncbi:MAG: OmpH family outer membrane protein [Gammaproteobacteria bacterium]|nr:OmpH family outer membrane protein [Gammaproteobacteria bacterium]